MPKIYLALFLLLFLLLGVCLPGAARNAPDNGQFQFDMGVYAFESGDYQAAAEYFQKALFRDKNNAYFNYYLGKTYAQSGEYSRAAVYLEKAVQMDKDLPGLDYHWAYVNYRLENFALAAKFFEQLTETEPRNVLGHYYAGMSRYKQDEYKQALTHLDRTAQIQSSFRYNADYYAAICHLQLGQPGEAKERLNRVREKAEDKSLRRFAAELLDRISRREHEKKRYSLTVKLGWEYNDNEALEPIDDYDLYPHEEDNSFRGSISGAYNLVNTEDFVLGAGYGHHFIEHDTLDQFDLSAGILDIYARYRLKGFNFSLAYKPHYYWLDSESYLCRHAFRSSIGRTFGSFRAEVSYTHQRNNHIYVANKDGYANQVFLRGNYKLPAEWGNLQAGIGYKVNSAEHDDYDYDSLQAELHYKRELWWGICCTIFGEYEYRDYAHHNSSYGELREDSKYSGNIIFSRDIVDDLLSLHIGYEYTEKNSNIDDIGKYNANYEYESNAVQVFFTLQI